MSSTGDLISPPKKVKETNVNNTGVNDTTKNHTSMTDGIDETNAGCSGLCAQPTPPNTFDPIENLKGLGDNLPLSSIEQGAPRTYNRIAATAQWTRIQATLHSQTNEIRRKATQAFTATLKKWPFLAGSFAPSNTHPDQLELWYRKDGKGLTQPALAWRLEIKPPLENPEKAEIDELPLETFGRDRFLWPDEPDPNKPFPPVTLKLTYAYEYIVLGFGFSKVLFDGEFIRNFLKAFGESTSGPFTSFSRGIVDRSLSFDNPAREPDRSAFDCYDWSDTTPRRQDSSGYKLLAKVIPISHSHSRILLDTVLSECAERERHQPVLVEDCIVALVWVAMMNTRHHLARHDSSALARMNIAYPAALRARSPQGLRPNYFGNSTVTKTAFSKSDSLLSSEPPENEQLGNLVSPGQLAHAATTIRSTLRRCSEFYFDNFASLKRVVSREDEQKAFKNALDRQNSGVSFEDWSWYGAQCKLNLLESQFQQPKLYPCCEFLEEGQIILLPSYNGNGNAQKSLWRVLICLEDSETSRVLDTLCLDSWVDGNDVAW